MRFAIYATVCSLGIVLLLAVFSQFRFEEANTYNAVFANVSGLRDSNFVRIAGVEVGKVKSVTVQPDSTVRVEFSADESVTLTEGSRAVIRYDDLFGRQVPRAGGRRGRRQKTQRRGNHPVEPDATGPRPGRVDRGSTAPVPLPRPRSGQRAERSVDPGVAGPGGDDRIGADSGRVRPQGRWLIATSCSDSSSRI